MADLATTNEVQTRLGRDLTEAEAATAGLVIEMVTGLIADLVDSTAEALQALETPPAYFRLLCIEKALGAIANPENLASISEQLGAHQESRTFPRAADVGVFLSETEERKVRRAARGSSFRAATLRSPYSGEDARSALDFSLPLEDA